MREMSKKTSRQLDREINAAIAASKATGLDSIMPKKWTGDGTTGSTGKKAAAGAYGVESIRPRKPSTTTAADTATRPQTGLDSIMPKKWTGRETTGERAAAGAYGIESIRPKKSSATTALPLDTPSIAAVVLERADEVKESTGPDGARGRFGKNKVFLSEIWKLVSRDPRLPGITRAQFANALVDAQRNEMLAMSRCDTPGHVDPVQFADSAIRHMGATYHFLDLGYRGR